MYNGWLRKYAESYSHTQQIISDRLLDISNKICINASFCVKLCLMLHNNYKYNCELLSKSPNHHCALTEKLLGGYCEYGINK